MSRFFLVRHGETIWHAENRYAGSSEVPLTPRGHEQAQWLADWAAGARISHLYVSPMTRARETAVKVERSMGLSAVVEERLREVSFGMAEGLTAAELRARHPGVFEAFTVNPEQNFFPGGEDSKSAAARARAACKEIARTCGPDARVLVVAHNTLFRILLCDLLEVPLSRYRSLFPSLRNGAVTELEIDGGSVALHSFNVPLRSGF